MLDRGLIQRVKCLAVRICRLENRYNTLTEDEFLAIRNSNSSSASNPFATMADILLVSSSVFVADNYSSLPLPNTVTGKVYWVKNSQGTWWLPGNLGGTYYPKGLYYSDGATWSFIETPYQATLATVNVGTNDDQFVTAFTFTNASKWDTKVNNRTTVYTVGNYPVTNTNRNIECNGTLTITFPLLASITHYENIDVTNNSLTDNVTISTTGGELMADFTTFTLYPLESLTIAKGNTTYLVK